MKKTIKQVTLFFSFILITIQISAQINSVYSRYGIGNLLNSQNTIHESMGGTGIAYPSFITNNIGQILNITNPSTYGEINVTLIDLAIGFQQHNSFQSTPVLNNTSNYLIPKLFAIGVPIDKTKRLGLAFGFRQISSISYNVNTNNYLPSGDTINNYFIGSGGLYQFFIGLGKKYKNFNIGFNTGINFGFKNTSLQKSLYGVSGGFYPSNESSNSNYWGIVFTPAFQYIIDLKKKEDKIRNTLEKYSLILGGSYNIQQNLNASKSLTATTVYYNQLGESVPIDSANSITQNGYVTIPATLTLGVSINKSVNYSNGIFKVWSLNFDYTSTKWTNYKSFNDQSEPLANSEKFSFGVEIAPNPVTSSYNSKLITYRAGLYIGNDYVKADGNTNASSGIQIYGISIGLGVPIKKYRSFDNQFSTINYSFSYGKKGVGSNLLTEDFVNFTLGFLINDIWFIKKRYD